MAPRAPDRLLEWHALDPAQASAQQLVRRILDLPGHVGVRRAPVGRVVLEPAVLGRVVRRGDNDAVGAGAAARVVREDRVRDRRRRRVAILGIDRDVDAAGDQHLDRGPERRFGECVRVAADEQRPVDPLRVAVAGDRLADREDVRLGECSRERGTAMARGPERHRLGGIGRIRVLVVVRPDQARRRPRACPEWAGGRPELQ